MNMKAALIATEPYVVFTCESKRQIHLLPDYYEKIGNL